MRTYTCPQTGTAVFQQPAIGHAAIAFSCSVGMRVLAELRRDPRWTDEELAGIDALVDGHEDSIIAHANAIIDRAFG